MFAIILQMNLFIRNYPSPRCPTSGSGAREAPEDLVFLVFQERSEFCRVMVADNHVTRTKYRIPFWRTPAQNLLELRDNLERRDVPVKLALIEPEQSTKSMQWSR